MDVFNPVEQSEGAVALEQIKARAKDSGIRPASVGADKGYHNQSFVGGCRELGTCGRIRRRLKAEALRVWTDAPRVSEGYKLSQKIRKQIEERFGWMKVIGGLRKTRSKGRDRVGAWGYFIGAACNMVLMARLAVGSPAPATQ